jgi:hypothetical protein
MLAAGGCEAAAGRLRGRGRPRGDSDFILAGDDTPGRTLAL